MQIALYIYMHMHALDIIILRNDARVIGCYTY